MENVWFTLEKLISDALDANDDQSRILGEKFHNCTKFTKFRMNDFYGSFTRFYGADNAAFYVWTDRYVYFHQYYDGTSNVVSIPRSPSNCIPEWIGGG